MLIEIAAAALLADASAEFNRPATPINRTAPDYPASCRNYGVDDETPQKVTVVYKVNRNGEVENVRVRQSTDACFDETAVAAVRRWRFEPAKANGVSVDQEDMETTFTFIFSEETRSEDFDAAPRKRYPPAYPERCMSTAESKETVVVEFDVTPGGETANARVVESTNSCLNGSAIAAVKKWRYRPKIEDGQPVARNGVQTAMTYELAGRFSPPPNRLSVGRRLNKVASDIRSGRDPQEVLLELSEIEEKYGDKFSRTELRAFHQLRGAARLSAKDYRGALDDFRVVSKLGISGESGEAIAKTIEQLEAIIAAEDAAAADGNSEESRVETRE